MDPLSAIGLASGIIQFIDFGRRVICKASNICADYETISIRSLARNLLDLSAKININQTNISYKLKDLLRKSTSTANELFDYLEKAEIQGDKTAWKSTRQAFHSVMGEEKQLEIEKRLGGYRNAIELRLLVEFRYIFPSSIF